MRIHDAQLSAEYEAIAFVRQCRREMNVREVARARQAAEALRAAQSDPPFDPFGEDAPELSRRLED